MKELAIVGCLFLYASMAHAAEKAAPAGDRPSEAKLKVAQPRVVQPNPLRKAPSSVRVATSIQTQPSSTVNIENQTITIIVDGRKFDFLVSKETHGIIQFSEQQGSEQIMALQLVNRPTSLPAIRK